MRQAIEANRAEARMIGDQPPAGTPEQAVDGSMSPRLPNPAQQPPRETEEPNSPRAERRIQELVAQLREKDQALQQAVADGHKNGETLQQMQARFTALEQQHQQMLQANLDHLDPETRAAVMQDARMAQRLDEFESRLLAKVQPQLRQLETKAARDEMAELSDVYPAFDYQIHGNLIDMYRGKNPNSTIAQAFRAIAEPEELVTRKLASAVAVPPVLPPGGTSLEGVRFAPKPEPQSDPKAEMADEMARIKKLRMSLDPNEQKEGLRLADQNLKKRLGYR